MKKQKIKFRLILLLVCAALLLPVTVSAAAPVYITEAVFAQWLGMESTNANRLTRKNMALLLVEAMDYRLLAESLSVYGSPFTDVTEQAGYLTLLRDLGFITTTAPYYRPNAYVSYAEASAAVIHLHHLLSREIDFIGGYYAIRSAPQMALMNTMDAVFFGWSRLTVDGRGEIALNTTASGGNEYRVPDGYQTPLDMTMDKTALLMVTVQPDLSAYVIADEKKRTETADLIVAAVNGLPVGTDSLFFDGVLIDIENLKGTTERENFNAFLTVLRNRLDACGKQMYVAVQPVRKPGQAYYDGYDFRTIGALADKVILMAHDYSAKLLTQAEMDMGFTVTPLTPLDEIYAALKAVTDPEQGVQDLEKLVLQISFDTAQWKTVNGKIIHTRPYTPTYAMLHERMNSGVQPQYSPRYANPYVTFYDAQDGTDNIIWYEDTRSLEAKVNLAKCFGVTALSFWRLGTIPDFSAPAYLHVVDWISDLR